ncbi:hypothetical protein Shyhy02_53560 [Streptomyces hygroscopicus subsp. hygroscopicus]|nr:hypothetical protein Shyhy02_53560 [Streptomyces hygroscopicus subsp. hygroscopicus]
MSEVYVLTLAQEDAQCTSPLEILADGKGNAASWESTTGLRTVIDVASQLFADPTPLKSLTSPSDASAQGTRRAT